MACGSTPAHQFSRKVFAVDETVRFVLRTAAEWRAVAALGTVAVNAALIRSTCISDREVASVGSQAKCDVARVPNFFFFCSTDACNGQKNRLSLQIWTEIFASSTLFNNHAQVTFWSLLGECVKNDHNSLPRDNEIHSLIFSAQHLILLT